MEAKAEPVDPGQIDSRFSERLGRAAMQFAYTEHLISQIFIVLTQGDAGAMYVVTQNISQQTLTNWIQTLIETKKQEPLDAEVLELLSEVDLLRADRNLYIHGLWGFNAGDGGATVFSIKLERSAVITDTVVTLADLDDFIAHTVQVNDKLVGILKGIGRLGRA